MSFSLNEFIVRIIAAKNPKTVEDLIQIAKDEYSVTQQNIVTSILRLEKQGKLVFRTDPRILKLTLGAYLMSAKGVWYLLVIMLSLITASMVYVVPEDAYPLNFIRYLFASFFVLLLPGYGLNKALFQAKELDSLERVGLSIGISITLASLISLVLNLSPWGVRIVPVTISLLALTTGFATIGLVRENEIITNRNNRL